MWPEVPPDDDLSQAGQECLCRTRGRMYGVVVLKMLVIKWNPVEEMVLGEMREGKLVNPIPSATPEGSGLAQVNLAICTDDEPVDGTVGLLSRSESVCPTIHV